MEKEFIPYELALQLKELRCNESCFAWHNSYKIIYSSEIDFVKNSDKWLESNQCSLPTFSQAFRWFREKYKLHSKVFFDGLKELEETDEERYDFDVVEQWTIGKDYFDYSYGFKHLYSSRGIYMSYEEAELECLKKLIKIVSK